MGISDEIEVATIVNDKARILEIKATISIAISVKFDASRAMTTKTPTKLKSTARLVFFFNLFPRFCSRCGGAELASSFKPGFH